jgi:hypothetical protein
VSGHGRFGTTGNGQVAFMLSNRRVTFVGGKRSRFVGDVESVTGRGNQAALTGAGTWKRTNGCVFVVSVVDKARKRRRGDTIEVVIRDPQGAILFTSFGPRSVGHGDISVRTSNR